MLDPGVHSGSAAGRALTAQDHSLVALITCRDLFVHAKDLLFEPNRRKSAERGAWVVPGVAHNPESENLGANDGGGGNDDRA